MPDIEEQDNSVEKEEPQRPATFQIMWPSLIGGFLFGFFAVIFILFVSRTYRRDKIYSSLLGFALGMLLYLILAKNGLIPAYP